MHTAREFPIAAAALRRRLALVLSTLLIVVAAVAPATPASAQARQDREGVTLHWGLVSAAFIAGTQAMSHVHAGPPQDGGRPHHLVVVLYDTRSGRRIGDAVVRAQLTEPGIVDAAPKYLVPMPVNDEMSWGQWFTTVARSGPYRFRVFVKLPDRPRDITFNVVVGASRADPG